jgi:hypothetical protein
MLESGLTTRDTYRTPRLPRFQVSAVLEEGRGRPLTEGHTHSTKVTCHTQYKDGEGGAGVTERGAAHL